MSIAIDTIAPVSLRLLGGYARQLPADVNTLDDMPLLFEQAAAAAKLPWLPDLFRLEVTVHQVRTAVPPETFSPACLAINPLLRLVPVGWRGLAGIVVNGCDDGGAPRAGEEIILVRPGSRTGEVLVTPARASQLLALKMVAEGMTPETAGLLHDTPPGLFRSALQDAVADGLLLSPPSAISRQYPHGRGSSQLCRQQQVEVFTLQWHLTQACDLFCRHCYDRSDRAVFPLDRALSLLQELCRFCDRRFVRPQVSLSGGNPLLHPHFFEIYGAAAGMGVMTAILGNATDGATMERLLAIRRPAYYQVSLEGLEQHNDAIRGAGNFRRTVAFLKLLNELGVPNMVMLTLTRGNLDQVLPLARYLEGITDGLTFNRLAPFGEGAALETPSRDEYRQFLAQYLAAAQTSPVLAFKDSLLNILLEREGRVLFGGCTGHGCGAAFNFLAVLSDGEVHACRKFPSPVGDIHTQDLETIYDSPAANRYRQGSSACHHCPLQPVCGGCPAATAGSGGDPFHDRDPYCFRT